MHTKLTATLTLTIFCLTQAGFAATYGRNLRTEAAAQGKARAEVEDAVMVAAQPVDAAGEGEASTLAGSTGKVVVEINAMASELVKLVPDEYAITIDQNRAVVITNQLAFDDGFLAFLPNLAEGMLKDVARFAVIVPDMREDAAVQRKMIEYFSAVMPEGKSIEIFDSETTAIEAMAVLDVKFYGTSGENAYAPSTINADLRQLLYDIQKADFDRFDDIQKKFRNLQGAVAAEV